MKISNERRLTEGFTLIETMTVVIMVGILAAIAAPSLFGMLERQRLSSANSQISQTLKKAQSNARKEKATWQVSFRQQGDTAQWVLHRASPSYSLSTAPWQSFDQSIRIDSSTTNNLISSTSTWQFQFDHKGIPINTSIPAKITLKSENSQARYCVLIKTLLGTIHSNQDEGCD